MIIKKDWYCYAEEVYDLIEHLIQTCQIKENWEDIRYVLEKPYKYEKEYEEMKEETNIKTFNDLKFDIHSGGLMLGRQARMKFPNGYGVSVIIGRMFYSNGIDTYELAIFKGENICYDTPITNDVLGYLSKEEVTEIMKKVQELK